MIKVLLLGKGGVGKTTLASVIATKLSDSEQTFLVSLDPAHNLFDVFQVERKTGIFQVTENLTIEEVYISERSKEILNETAKLLKNRFRYLETIRVERVIDMMAKAPGSEEFVYVNVLFDIMNKTDTNIILDFPPTGIALRILTLPFTSRQWAETLLGLRKQIVKLQETIARLHNHEIEEDDVLLRLIQYQNNLEKLITWLLDRRTVCIVVVQPEPLSIFEGKSIIARLQSLGFKNIWLVCNRCKNWDLVEENFGDVKGVPTFQVGETEFIPVGLKAVREFPLPDRMVKALKDLKQKQ